MPAHNITLIGGGFLIVGRHYHTFATDCVLQVLCRETVSNKHSKHPSVYLIYRHTQVVSSFELQPPQGFKFEGEAQLTSKESRPFGSQVVLLGRLKRLAPYFLVVAIYLSATCHCWRTPKPSPSQTRLGDGIISLWHYSKDLAFATTSWCNFLVKGGCSNVDSAGLFRATG